MKEEDRLCLWCADGRADGGPLCVPCAQEHVRRSRSGEREPLVAPVGCLFDTVAERGCTATSEPDAVGNFLAVDSDGVECEFSTQMIVQVCAAS